MFHEQLMQQTQAARQAFLAIPILQRGIRGDIDRATYLRFLHQAFHHVRHTVPLLMACGSRIAHDQEWLRSAIAEYIEEEIGHEEWILNDIEACGGDKQAARDSQPAPATELMVAYAYDSVQRRNPVSFFGMVLVLEGTSVALATEAAERIQQQLALPDAAFSYLRSHGSLDIGHMDFFARLMNRIEDPQDQQAIIHMARMMYRLYGGVFQALDPDSPEETDT